MKKVSIYSTATCTYCKHAKDFFKDKGIQYDEFDVGIDQEKRKEMVDLTGQLGVPVIRIDDHIMVGYDQNAVAKALGL